ncbi:MAG TPA: helix-turn-helix transcriptional regulator, partial [Microbacterium sp.]|nr:helix-turn-helix transcriptional regulator [Microbacterium sp.]
PQLTKRERVVLGGLHLYDSNADLAAALVISPNTVKTQLRSAYRKLGVTNRAEALVRMAVLGIDGDGGSPE